MDSVWSWMRHNMGDVPNWVSALGTIAAFFAVVVQLRREQTARHRMEERRRAEEHRAQASRVAAWFEGLPARNPLDPMPEPGSPAAWGDRGRLVISNSSSLPIYEVVVDYDADGPNGARAEQHLWVELLPPGDWVILADTRPSWLDGTVAVSFVDAAGRNWSRGRDFQLRVTPQPPLQTLGLDPSHMTRERIEQRVQEPPVPR